jgi:hypothetical protein
MATSPTWYQASPSLYPGYTSSTNPRNIATAQGQNVVNQGNQLMSQEANYLNNYVGAGTPNNVTNTAYYLNSIESPLAQGQGGYNAQETSQIQMTPQQQHLGGSEYECRGWGGRPGLSRCGRQPHGNGRLPVESRTTSRIASRTGRNASARRSLERRG